MIIKDYLCVSQYIHSSNKNTPNNSNISITTIRYHTYITLIFDAKVNKIYKLTKKIKFFFYSLNHDKLNNPSKRLNK